MSAPEDSNEYKEAIAYTTRGWSDVGIGFTTKDNIPSLASLSRQLNSLLFTTIQLRREVAILQKEVEKLSQEKPDISALTEQLRSTHLSQQGKQFRDKGKIKVYKNPFDLLKQIK